MKVRIIEEIHGYNYGNDMKRSFFIEKKGLFNWSRLDVEFDDYDDAEDYIIDDYRSILIRNGNVYTYKFSTFRSIIEFTRQLNDNFETPRNE